MTTTLEQLRAVVLSVVLVSSMIVGSVTLTGTVAATNHADVQVEDGSVDVQTNHNWTISPRQSGSVDTIEFDYSQTGVDVSNLSSTSDLGVLINGSAVGVEQINSTADTARIFLSQPYNVSSDSTVDVLTTGSDFDHPATEESSEAQLALLNQTTSSLIDSATQTINITSNTTSEPSSSSGFLEGYVRNSSSGNPIAGASIRILQNGSLVTTTSADSSGFYALELANETYDVEAFAEQYNSTAVNGVSISDSTTTTLNVSLDPNKSSSESTAAGLLEGYIADSSTGDGIGGASVTVSNSTTQTVVASDSTGPSGAYGFELATGTYDLRANATGYQAKTLTGLSVSKNTTTKQNVTLTAETSSSTKTGYLEGYVVDNSTGDAIGGASVSVLNSTTGTEIAGTTTDMTGQYVVEVDTGTHNVEIYADGYVTETYAGVPISENATTGLNASLTAETSSSTKTGYLEGYVVDNSTGDTIGGASVTVLNSTTGTEIAGTTTDSTGQYFLEVDTGTHNVEVYADGYNLTLANGVSITENTTASLNVTLTPDTDSSSGSTGTLQGTVVDNSTGDTIGGADVYVVTDSEELVASGQTAPDGSYSLSVTNGTYDVQVSTDGYYTGIVENVTIVENTTTSQTVALDPDSGGSSGGTETEGSGNSIVNGTVTDTSGNPVSGAEVAVFDPYGDVFEYDVTSSTGDYNISVPNGTYVVEARAAGYGSVRRDGVTATANNTTTVDLTLPPAGYVAGQVTDQSGTGIGSAEVVVHDDSYQVYQAGMTDPSGNFNVTVPEGEYTLEVDASGYGPETVSGVSVTSGSTTTQGVTLNPPAVITGTVTDSSGTAVSSASVMATNGESYTYSQTDSNGQYTLELSASSYSLQSFTQGGLATSDGTVQINSSETKTVDLTIVNPTIHSSSVTHINGTAPTSDISLSTRLQGGFMQLQLLGSGDTPGMPAELEDDGVDHTTEFRINLTVEHFEPNSLLWGARDAAWSAEQNSTDANLTDITIETEPVHLAGIDDPQLPIGLTQNYEQISWPSGSSDRADLGWNETVYFGLFDLSNTGGFAQGLDGMTVTTNAQTFSRPQMTNGTLDVYVGGPHTTTYGETHEGFYRAFIPNAQLEEWNVSNPETELVARFKGDAASFSVDNSSSEGAWIDLDVHYSDGLVEVGNTSSVDSSTAGPAEFDVSVESSNAPVAEGETLNVTAELQNVGDARGTQTITFAVSDHQVSKDVTLSAGQERSVTLSWDTTAGDAGTYNASVASANTTASTTVSISKGASFDVALEGTNAPVTEGETLTTSTTVSNTGSSQGTQTVSLSIGGTVRDSTDVTLAGGESQTVELNWSTTAGDAGNYTATVSSADDSASTGATVDTPAHFAMAIDSTTAPVTEGERLNVTATVTNTGETQDSQTIELGVGGTVEASRSVQLAGGESQPITLGWNTGVGDAGNYTASISSADDSASVSVHIKTQANLAVTVDSTTSPVIEGETMTVSATVENTGETQDSQTIDLGIGGTIQDSTTVSLAGGESQSVDLAWNTSAGDAGNYTATVTNADNSASTSVRVKAQANFAVAIDSTTAPVTEGETVTATATVENTGETQATQTIGLGIDGTREDSVTVTLAGGERQTVDLAWSTAAGDAGTHTLGVASEDTGVATEIQVTSPAFFDVAFGAVSEPVTEGETVTASVSVENTGGTQDSQSVAFAVAGTTLDTRTVQLAGGESQIVEFTWNTSVGDAGNYTATVSSADSSSSTGVRVRTQANVTVAIDSTTAPVTEGEIVTATAFVENVGETEDSQTISLAVDGSAVTTTQLTLAGGQSKTVDLAWETAVGDAGTHTITVASDDDAATTEVDVKTQANFAVAVDSTTAPVTEGETVTATALVENTGETQGTQTVALAVAGSVVDSTSVTLAGGANQTVDLAWSTAVGDAGTYTANLSTADDTASADVKVKTQANVDVAFESVAEPVTVGNQLDVAASIENTGETEATRTVELQVDGSVVDSTSVTLAGGANQTIDLAWSTADGDVGTHFVTLSSPDDTASTNASVVSEAAFRVTLDEATTSVTEGESVRTTATIENVGGTEVTQTITLAIDDSQQDSVDVTLAGGERQTVDLSWATTTGDAGTYTLTVASDDDTATADVDVKTPANVAVTLDSTSDPLTEGEQLNVTATVENTGETTATQTIALGADDAQQDSVDVTLAGGESKTIDLAWNTEVGDAGDRTVTVESADATASTTVDIKTQANFDVDVAAISDVTEGETVVVNATVENTGETKDTQTVDVTIGGTQRGSTELTLAGNESQSVQFKWQTGDGDAGSYDAVVASDDSSDFRAVTVKTPAAFDVRIDETNAPVLEGDRLTVTATVENTGETQDTQTVDLTVGGTQRDSTELTLDGLSSQTIKLAWRTQVGDHGSYTATMSTADASNSTSVRVTQQDNFDVSIDSTSAPVTGGQTVTTTATVENTGGTEATQTIELYESGQVRDSTDVTLDAGESQTVALDWNTTPGDTGSNTITIASDDDTASTGVSVNAPAYFGVGIDATNVPVTEGETLAVVAAVENLGGTEATQPIELQADGAVRDTAEVTLAGGERTTVELAWQTTVGQNGSYTPTVTSSNTTASRAITIEQRILEGTLTGVVTDEQGNNVDDATVSVSGLGTNAFEYDKTDNGEYSVKIPAGEYTITAGADAYGTNKTEGVIVAEGQTTTQDLTLPSSGTISGTIKNGSGAVAGADVLVHDESYEVSKQLTADDSGQFEVSVPAGEYTIEADGPGNGPGSKTVSVEAAGQVSQDVTLAAPAVIEGKVTRTGQAVDDATVIATNGDSYSYTTTDSSGSYSFELSPGNYSIRTFKGDQLATTDGTIEVNSSETKVEDFQLLTPEVKSTSVEHIGGTKPAEAIEADAALSSSGGYLQVGLRGADETAATGTPVELSDEGVDHTTEFRINLTVEDYEPNSLLWGARDVEWSASEHSTKPQLTNITIETKPVHFEGIDPASGPPVGLIDNYETVEWPDVGGDQATISRTETVYFGLFDIAQTGEFAEGLDGMTVTTNAQTFSRPQMTNGTLDVYVGAPHNTVAGNTHDGFYRAFIPNEQLSEWEVSDPETELAARFKGDAASFSVDNSSEKGALIELDVHYSDGLVEVGDSTSVQTTSGTPDFDVTIDSTNQPVLEGEQLNVTATVQNVGDGKGTQTITLDVGGQRNSTDVTLNPGQSEQLKLSWDTSAGDGGDYTAWMNSSNTSASADVTIDAPQPKFDVTIDSTNGPVTEGEQLDVTAIVRNTGDAKDTQTVTLNVSDGDTENEYQQELTLDAGEQNVLDLSWTTSSGDADTYTADVASADTTDDVTVSVTQPASFDDVTIDSITQPVTEGDAVQVGATIENTGGTEETQTITLDMNGTQYDSQDVTLAGGESKSITLSWDTVTGDAGDYDATVASTDGSATKLLTVDEVQPANFDVTLDAASSSVQERETVTATATVVNTGDVKSTQTIELKIDGTQYDTQSVTLAGGASQTVDLSWDTARGDAGTYTLAVSSDDTSGTGSLTVEALDPANFDVTLDSNSESVVMGGTLTLTATVQNTGDLGGTQTITMDVNGTQRDSQSITLAGGASQTIDLSWATESGDNGSYTGTVASANDTDSASVDVQKSGGSGGFGGGGSAEPLEPGQLSVAVESIDDTVSVGDSITVTVDVTNTGEQIASGAIEARLDGTTIESQRLSLGSGETRTIVFSLPTDEQRSPGPASVVVASSDKRATATVDVTDVAGTVEDDEQTGPEADTDEQGEQAIGADEQDTEADTAETTDSGGADSGAGSAGGSDMPGFGLLVTILALLSALALVRREE